MLADLGCRAATATGSLPNPAKQIGNGPSPNGDPSRIRTCNPRSRNPLLYPVELWDRNFRTTWLGQFGLHSIANMKNPPSGQAPSEPFSVWCDKACAVGRWLRSARNALLRHSRPPARQGLFDECRMRLFC